MNKGTLIEVQVAVGVGPDKDPAEVLAEVSKAAFAFKEALPDVAHFSVSAREVALQKVDK